MSNADNILTFGSFDANDGTNTFLVGDLVLGAPSREVEFLGGPGVDIARVGAVDTSQPVESSFTVLIADTTVDGVTARVAALAAELDALSPITIGLKGSAYIGTLRPLVARYVEIPLDSTAAGMLVNKYRTQVEVSVLREPWVYGGADQLVSPSLVAPASPDGATFPASWAKTQPTGSNVSASGGQFVISTTNAETVARATSHKIPVTAGASYTARCNMQVTARTSGYALAQVVWYTSGDTTISVNVIRSVGYVDASPVTAQVTATAPPTAVYARVMLEAGQNSTLTVKYDHVKFAPSLPQVPAVLDLSTQKGQAEAALDIMFDADGLEVSEFFIGHYPHSAAVGDFVKALGGAQWTDSSGTSSSVGDAAGYSSVPMPVPDATPNGSTFPSTWTASPSSTYVHAESSKFHIEADASNPITFCQQKVYTAVRPNTAYTISVVAGVLSVAGGHFYLRAQWFDANYNYLSSSAIADLTTVSPEQTRTGTVTSHSNAAYGWLEARWTSATGTCAATAYGWTWWPANCRATEGTSYTDIDVSAYEPGEYQVLVKAKTADASDPGTVATTYGTATTITTTDLRWYALGTVALPTSHTRPGRSSTLRLTMTGAGSGNAVTVNAVAFVPVSWGGYVAWRPPSGHCHVARIEGGAVYLDDSTDLTYLTGSPRIRALRGCLLLIAEQSPPAALTPLEVMVTASPRWEQFPAAGLAPGQLVFDGDSLSGDAPTKYPAQLQKMLPGWTVQNKSSSGHSSTDVLSGVGDVIALYNGNLGTNIVCVWAGANDVGVDTFDNIVSYATQCRAVGFKVVVFTYLPRTDSYGVSWGQAWIEGRHKFNAAVRAYWHNFADALADVAADPRLGGSDTASDNPVYFSDRVHLTEAGYKIVAEIVRDAIWNMRL